MTDDHLAPAGIKPDHGTAQPRYKRNAFCKEIEGNQVRVDFETSENGNFLIIEKLEGPGIISLCGSDKKTTVLEIETDPWSASMDKTLLGPFCLVMVNECAEISPFLISRCMKSKLAALGLVVIERNEKELDGSKNPTMADLSEGIEIFSRSWDTTEGKEFRHIWLKIDPDGAVQLSGHDMGPSVERYWNHDDYEYDLKIPAESADRFLLLVLREGFNSTELLTIGKLKTLCEKDGIDVKFWTWP